MKGPAISNLSPIRTNGNNGMLFKVSRGPIARIRGVANPCGLPILDRFIVFRTDRKPQPASHVVKIIVSTKPASCDAAVGDV